MTVLSVFGSIIISLLVMVLWTLVNIEKEVKRTNVFIRKLIKLTMDSNGVTER